MTDLSTIVARFRKASPNIAEGFDEVDRRLRLVEGKAAADDVLIGDLDERLSRLEAPVVTPPPPPPSGGLAFKRPDTTGFQTIFLNNSSPNRIDITRDTILRCSERLTRLGGLMIWMNGDYKCVGLGLDIEQTAAEGTGSIYDHTCLKIRGSGGLVYLEGTLLGGPTSHDGLVIAAPSTDLVVQVAHSTAHHIQDGHPDCFQVQGGAKSIKFDRFTGYVSGQDAHGTFLKVEGGQPIGPVDFRHVNIHGAFHTFWQETKDIGPISLTEYWDAEAQQAFGKDVWPDKDAQGQADTSRRAIVSADGSYLTFQNSNISGRINKGVPPGGDFVLPSQVGMNYAG